MSIRSTSIFYKSGLPLLLVYHSVNYCFHSFLQLLECKVTLPVSSNHFTFFCKFYSLEYIYFSSI